jgi:protein TonB
MILAMASALVIAQADPVPPASAAQQEVPPRWLHKATGEDVRRVYPPDALQRGVEGIVMVSCQVTEKGEMAECRVEQEAPAGEGFGDAALKLMPRFLMRPPTRDGVPVAGATVRLPIQFRLPR